MSMDDNAGKFYIEDGKTKTAEEPAGLQPNDGVLIYDVIRIIDGIPLFLRSITNGPCSPLKLWVASAP